MTILLDDLEAALITSVTGPAPMNPNDHASIPALPGEADRQADEPSATKLESDAADGKAAAARLKKAARQKNNVRKVRIERMMSKAELARRANLSVLTIDRIEKGFGCRMDTKRKILEALGLTLADRIRVFGDEE